MANQNKSEPLDKFKRIANEALRMEREKSQLDLPVFIKTSKSRHGTDPQDEFISIQVPQKSQSPSSQPPSTRRDTNTRDSGKTLNTQASIQLEAQTLLSCNLDDNMDENVIFGRLQASQARTPRSQDDHLHFQRTVHDRIHPQRTLDDHIFSRHPKHNHVYQCSSQHPIRVARAAAAAAASTVAAQSRKDAIAAVARQHAPYIRMTAVSNASSASSSAAQNEKRRVIRNSNLLNSALCIIREMDPAFLEMLCYAIHDQVTKDDPSESD